MVFQHTLADDALEGTGGTPQLQSDSGMSSWIRVLATAVVALAAIGCNAIGPTQPRIDCQTGDPAACSKAAEIALANAPAAIGTPTQLIITSGGMRDCKDPRPIVCPWNVRLVYGEGNDTFTQDQLVATTGQSGWMPVRVVPMTPEPSSTTH